MKERPIIFSAPMVLALLDGRKTQTRRMVKPPRWAEPDASEMDIYGVSNDLLAIAKSSGCLAKVACPYGEAGGRLWVRETWALENTFEYFDRDFEMPGDGRPIRWDSDDADGVGEPFKWPLVPRYRATEPDTLLVISETAEHEEDAMLWTPSIFMPRWASRITLEITEVRVQRLQAISHADALAEGISVLPLQSEDDLSAWYQSAPGVDQERSAEASYASLWESINGKGSWHTDPWVWALSFERVEAGLVSQEVAVADLRVFQQRRCES